MLEDEELLCVGNEINFDYFGKREQGIIKAIGKHGYWVESAKRSYGTAYIRCPFEFAKLVSTT